MNSLWIGSLLISLLHAIIPNHWLPLVAIGRKEKWTLAEIMQVTFLSGLAHVLSTIFIGLLLGLIGAELSVSITQFSKVIAPSLLILLGLYFIIQHYRHHHFHLHQQNIRKRTKSGIILSLTVAMFLSPCMEIEPYFLLAGTIGNWALLTIALMYATVTLTGMMIWVTIAYKGMVKFNWHNLEHNAGIITGVILILSGLFGFLY
jgi:nickel/cobalt exporter